MSFLPGSCEDLRRRRELAGDVLEDVRDAGAGRANRTDGDQSDERDEQRVLEQVLAFVLTHERLQVGKKHRHWKPPPRLCTALRCGVAAAPLVVGVRCAALA